MLEELSQTGLDGDDIILNQLYSQLYSYKTTFPRFKMQGIEWHVVSVCKNYCETPLTTVNFRTLKG